MLNHRLNYCVVGLGITGISCLDFLLKHNISHIIATDLQDKPELKDLRRKYPQVKFFLGDLIIPEETDVIILSPGIDQFLPIIKKAVLGGAILTNDINLFLEELNHKKYQDIKIAAVTGTNGKTTVVNILAEMAKMSGISYALCGNIGDPVLNYLPTPARQFELYILELSSFQLELVDQLECDVACILNITPDHLDRYPDFTSYYESKLKIYANAKNLVYYRDDAMLLPLKYTSSFGKNYTGRAEDYSLDPTGQWLLQGSTKIMAVDEIAMKGEHNVFNALAAIAIGKILGFSLDHMLQVLKNFTGLEHRYQFIAKFEDEIVWINDSKGTNIGATLAAINATVKHKQYKNNNIIIILGGLNKNVDLTMLKPLVISHCKAAILIGESKEQLFNILHAYIDCHIVATLKDAVTTAKAIANQTDLVLFSPACASFDMFDNYKHRGEVFKQCVLSLYHESNH